jgi:integrase
MECSDIKSYHFTQLQEALVKEGKSPGTVNRICAAVHTVLTELLYNDVLTSVPKYRGLTEPETKRGYFTREELSKLIDNCTELGGDAQLLEDSIKFSLMTGCRLGELLKLTWDGVNFENGEVTFTDVKTAHATGQCNHTVPMTDDLRGLLNRMYKERLDNDQVFPWKCKDTVNRRFQRLKQVCGLPKDARTWHTIRHTCGTWMVESGVPIRSVMATLNHRNIATTLRYAKGTKKAVAEAMETLNVGNL